MSNYYKVLSADGQEYGPATVEDLRQWYIDGRIGKDNYVLQVKTDQQWHRLEEVFELSDWIAPSVKESEGTSKQLKPDPLKGVSTLSILGLNPAAAPDTSETPETPETIEAPEKPARPKRRPGMLAAAIVLFSNAALILLFAEFTQEKFMPNLLGVAFWDVIVGIQLLRYKDRWRKFALLRAAGGAIAFGIGRAILVRETTAWIDGISQIFFAGGIFLLLYGNPPSRSRVRLGVITIAFTLISFSTYDLIWVVVPELQTRNQLKEWTIPGSRFADGEAGVAFDLPKGWSMISNQNPVMELPDARMVAVNMDVGCYAAFMIEEIPEGSLSLDEYLSQVLENKKTKRPTAREITRASLQFGRKNGRRLLTAWESKGVRFRGFNTVCSDGESYYMLIGWCDEKVFNQAYQSFRQLEEGFKLSRPPKETIKPATPMLGSSDAG